VSDAFANCFKQFDLANELGVVLKSKSKSKGSRKKGSFTNDDNRSVLEAFSTDAYQVKHLLLSHNWTLSKSRRVFWLGSLSWSGSWTHYPYPNGTLLAAATKRIKLKSITDSIGQSQCTIINNHHHRMSCSHYSTNLSVLYDTYEMMATDSVTSLQYPTTTITQQIILNISQSLLSSSSSSLSTKDVITNVTSSSSSSSSSLSPSSPHMPRTSYHTGIEERSCAPAVFLVGFMKTASSFLYDALIRHPNIVPALCGAQYKETNCYKHDANGETDSTTSPSRLLQRSWCFPFIEPSEQFITVDGTIAYMIDPSIAKSIKEVAGCILISI